MLVPTDCGSARARQQQQLDFKLLPSILLYFVTEYSSDTVQSCPSAITLVIKSQQCLVSTE